MKFTNTKVILTGSIIQVYQYADKSLAYGSYVSGRNKAGRKIDVIDEASKLRKAESRKKSKQRSGVRFRELIISNAWHWVDPFGNPYAPIFITFTFENDIRDVGIANAYFSCFINRLNRKVFGGSRRCNLKYVSVIEFQDLNRDGVVHYHTIFFNLPINDTDILFKLWGHGFITKMELKELDEIESVGMYASKELSADNNDDRLDGRKHYFSSRGLFKPIKVRDQSQAQAIVELIPKECMVRKCVFGGYQGRVEHACYHLNKGENMDSIINKLTNII